MTDITRQWLLHLALAVERWAIDEPRAALATPAGVIDYVLQRIPDEAQRAAVLAALPTITTQDFAEAARQIREVAERMP